MIVCSTLRTVKVRGRAYKKLFLNSYNLGRKIEMYRLNSGISLRKYVSVFVICLLLIMACPLIVLANGAVVSIGDSSADYGAELTVDVGIAGVTDMGAVDIWIQYDSTIVEVVSIADGNLGQINSGIDNTGGVARMNWFSATGQSGDFVFASVTLHAVGDAGDTSPLRLDVSTIIDITGADIEYVVNSGEFTVTGEEYGKHNLMVSSTVGGSVTTPGEGTFTCDDGELVELVASPEEGYEFGSWIGDTSTVADISDYTTTITMDGSKSINAVFTGGTTPVAAVTGGLSTTAIVGISVGLVAVAVVVVLLVRKRRRYN